MKNLTEIMLVIIFYNSLMIYAFIVFHTLVLPLKEALCDHVKN